MSVIMFTDRFGQHFFELMETEKRELHFQMECAVADFLDNGGKITVCPPGVARGASFSRNQHPRNGLKGVDRPSIYG